MEVTELRGCILGRVRQNRDSSIRSLMKTMIYLLEEVLAMIESYPMEGLCQAAIAWGNETRRQRQRFRGVLILLSNRQITIHQENDVS